MERFALSAESRDNTGKGAARKIRALGRIPAILYGEKKDPTALSIDRREISMLFRSHEGIHLLVDLNVSGASEETTMAMVKDLVVDPVSQVILHADFQRVDPKKAIHTTVPIHVTGLAEGVREGGVQQHVMREIEVSALPADMPEFIEVDISHLHIGMSIHVSDIVAEDVDYTILAEDSRVIASVLAPKVIEEEVEEEVEGEGEEGAEEGAEGEGAAESEDSGDSK